MSEAIQAATSTATEEEQKPPIPTTENERRWQIIHKVNWENIDTASFRAIDSYTEEELRIILREALMRIHAFNRKAKEQKESYDKLFKDYRNLRQIQTL
jgi:hypothetical protein